jgi:hypothetical protein
MTAVRHVAVLALAIVVAATIHLTVPRIVVACSCVPPETILTMAAEDPSSIVFTGETGPAVGAALPVSVTGWYGSTAPVDVVTLQVQTGDSASCGMNPPPAGGEYLFSAYPDESGQLAINGCSVVADLSTPEGRALQAQAEASLGPPASPPPPAAPSAPPASDATGGITAIAPVVIVGIFVLGAIVGFIGLRRRRPEA